MSRKESNRVLLTIVVPFMVFGIFGASPLSAVTAFVDANGPYEGEVGEEIVFDAGGSHLSNGSQIEAFYWDWDGDGQWDESFSTPEARHTWFSAFAGEVRVYVFYSEGVDWADARVTIEGPETAVALTLGPSAALHLRSGGGQSFGFNETTGVFDFELAGATMMLVPPVNQSGEPDDDAPVGTWSTLYTVPLGNGSDYTATLTGNQAGPFELRLQGIQDGTRVSNAFLAGQIKQGETIQVDISVSFIGGNLQVDAGPLVYSSEMAVDPDDEIELAVQPGGRYSTVIAISETEGVRPLQGVALTSTELNGGLYAIPVSDVSFTPNGFDVEAGSQQEVIMTVDVPPFFLGQVAGTVTVKTIKGPSEEIDLIVRKAGAHAPTIEVVSPVYGVVGSPVEFDATGSYDKDGGIESYCWDWDLTGQYECFDGPVAEHAWNRSFSGVVRLRVVDDEGNQAQQYVQVVIAD